MAYDNLTFDKSIYAANLDFTKALEALDPSSAYLGTELAGTDAFERQLLRYGIRLKGTDASRVEKFFQNAQTAVLFPEYIARTVRTALEEAEVLNRLCAVRTHIDGMDYRSIESTDLAAIDVAEAIAEGAELGTTQIKNKAQLVQLQKYGRRIMASYEAVRGHSIALFTVMLKRIGTEMANAQLNAAVTTLLTSVDAANTIACDGTTANLQALAQLWSAFESSPLSVLICGMQRFTEIVSDYDFTRPDAGLKFVGTGNPGTPVGALLIKSALVPDDCILGLAGSDALEMVESGSIVTDYEKWISHQFDCASVTATAGFNVITPASVKKLTFGASGESDG
ncbi:MAG: phage major capsid protein [Oscillospiraceae bacterium]|jgi:hypothetical protein|nr:phage major capsid protein [Oscillospiraceae bacterium]